MENQKPTPAVPEAAAEAQKANIVMLPVQDLHPHPDNPRKDVGDVTELSESIKVNGVLQNLTVVPGHWMTKEEWMEVSARYKQNPTEEDRVLMNKKWLDTGYTVIIGHRRLAASKQAGMTEMPCVIVEMTHKEQVSTMLTENMQRVDLTVYEQANGFQMMLDMGDSMDEIAEKSGFSKTTVRKRLEIAKLDSQTLKKVSSRQLTIGDFDELAKIDDIEVRNKLLGSIGTANFKNELQSALKDQQTAKRMEEWISVIRTFATEDPEVNYSTHQYITNYSNWQLSKEVAIPEDASTVKYFYKIGKNQIDIYKEKDMDKEAAEKAEREEKQRKAELRRQRYEDINDRHYDLRRDFVKNLSNAVCKRNALAIFGYVANTLYVTADGYSAEMDLKLLSNLLGVKIDESYLEEDNRLTEIPGIRTALEAFPEKTIFCMAYCLADDASTGYWSRMWNCGQYDYQHTDNTQLDALYSALESLGYEMSDEEKEMQSGNHVVFLPRYGDEDEDDDVLDPEDLQDLDELVDDDEYEEDEE